jgi:hypothetical protein
MSIQLNDNLEVKAPKPTDNRFGTYPDTATALSSIVESERYQGLTVGILTSGSVVEYWFKDGVADLDLVEKDTSISGVEWGDITGTLSNQTDLQNALNTKVNYNNYLEVISPRTLQWEYFINATVQEAGNLYCEIATAVGNIGKTILIKLNNNTTNKYFTLAAQTGQFINGFPSINFYKNVSSILLYALDASNIRIVEISEPSLLMSVESASSNIDASYGNNYICDSSSPFTVTSPNPSENSGKFFRVHNSTGEESIEVVEFAGSASIVTLEPTESCVIFSNGTENALFSLCPVKAVDMSWAFDYVETSDDNYEAVNGELINFNMNGATGNKNIILPALGGPSDIKPVIVAVTGISNFNLIVNAPEGGIIQRASSSVIMVPKQIMTFLPTLENPLNYIIKDSDLSKNATIARLIANSFDEDEFRDNINAISKDINGLASKATPVGADELIISDSEASNVLKKIAISALPNNSSNQTVSGFNDSGISYAAFTVVYVKYDSVTDNRREIWEAQADDLASLQGQIGILPSPIADGASGDVLLKGILENVNTSSFEVDDILYVSPSSAGLYTNVKPTGENFVVELGRVSVKDATVGKIEIDVKPIYSVIVKNSFEATDFNNFMSAVGSPFSVNCAAIFNMVTGTVKALYNLDSVTFPANAQFQLNKAAGFGNNVFTILGAPTVAYGFTSGGAINILTSVDAITGLDGATEIKFDVAASGVTFYNSSYTQIIVYNLN